MSERGSKILSNSVQWHTVCFFIEIPIQWANVPSKIGSSRSAVWESKHAWRKTAEHRDDRRDQLSLVNPGWVQHDQDLSNKQFVKRISSSIIVLLREEILTHQHKSVVVRCIRLFISLKSALMTRCAWFNNGKSINRAITLWYFFCFKDCKHYIWRQCKIVKYISAKGRMWRRVFGGSASHC